MVKKINVTRGRWGDYHYLREKLFPTDRSAPPVGMEEVCMSIETFFKDVVDALGFSDLLYLSQHPPTGYTPRNDVLWYLKMIRNWLYIQDLVDLGHEKYSYEFDGLPVPKELEKKIDALKQAICRDIEVLNEDN